MSTTPRLTNYQRDAFVRAIMDDVPEADYKAQIEEIGKQDLFSQLPAEVLALWRNEKTRCFLNENYRSISSGSVCVTVSGPFPHRDRENWKFELSEKAKRVVAKLVALQTAQEEKRTALRQKLRSAAYGVTTRNALVTLLPEFEKYAPAARSFVTDRSLPVIANLVADLVKAGWPKEKVAA